MKIVPSLWQETILTRNNLDTTKKRSQRLPSVGEGPKEHLSFAIKVYMQKASHKCNTGETRG